MNSYTIPPDCQIPKLKEIYDQYFGSIDTGFFVEVGAYDGRSWTNTGFLADIGWNGIYIEPVSSHMERCKNNHKDNTVHFEQCAVGTNESSTVDIFLAEGLSTIDEMVHTAHSKMYKQTTNQKESVDVYRLDTILQKYNVKNDFELLVVDTEGYEKEVFDSFNLNVWNPKMIIVELCDVHPSYNRWSEIQSKAKSVRQSILDCGYVTVYLDSINTIFWKS